MAFLSLVGAFVANGVANVLLKVGADRGIVFDLSLGIGKLMSLNAYLIGGVVLFVVNIVFYIFALRVLPLSVAYPVMVGMSLLIANTCAVVLLHETISWQHIIGYAFIVAGVSLVVIHGT